MMLEMKIKVKRDNILRYWNDLNIKIMNKAC